MQFEFVPGKRTADTRFIVRRVQEEYQTKNRKLHMCFVDMEKGFDRILRKVMEVAMRKNGLSEVMNLAVTSSYDDAKTRMRVRSVYSEEFEVKIAVDQGSVLSSLLFVKVVDVTTEKARCVVNELLYADDLVLMSETMEDLK